MILSTELPYLKNCSETFNELLKGLLTKVHL